MVVNARSSSWSVSNALALSLASASAVSIALFVAFDWLLSFHVEGELDMASRGQEQPNVTVEVEECCRLRVGYVEGGRTKMLTTEGKDESKFLSNESLESSLNTTHVSDVLAKLWFRSITFQWSLGL